MAEVIARHGLSQRRACGLIEITRRSYRRAPKPDRNRELRVRLRSVAEERRRWGCPMLYQVLRREGWQVNHKRIEACIGRKDCRCAGDVGANDSVICAWCDRRRLRQTKRGRSISFTTAY